MLPHTLHLRHLSQQLCIICSAPHSQIHIQAVHRNGSSLIQWIDDVHKDRLYLTFTLLETSFIA